MRFGITAETDITVTNKELREFITETTDRVQAYFAAQTSDPDDWLLIYCPIIMSEKFIGDFPARSKALKKQKELTCCPQLDHEAYINSDKRGRRSIFVLGLLDASDLMKRTALDDEFIRGFSSLCRSLASDNE